MDGKGFPALKLGLDTAAAASTEQAAFAIKVAEVTTP
jgi:hypothetical protein